MNLLQKLSKAFKSVTSRGNRLKSLFDPSFASMRLGSEIPLKNTSKEEINLIFPRTFVLYQVARRNFGSIPKEGYDEDSNPEKADDLIQMGKSLKAQGNSKDALNYFEQALKIKKRIYKGNHEKIMEALFNVGSTLKALGNSQKALDYYKEALEMNKNLFKEDNADRATLINNIGGTLLILGRSQEALDYLKQGLAIRQKIFQRENNQIVSSLFSIGSTLHKSGKPQEGVEYMMQALRMKERISPEAWLNLH